MSRHEADPDGHPSRGVRSRVLSGIQNTRLDQLSGLIASIGEPCWAFGETAAAVHGFDGVALRPPFHVVVPRHRNVRRIGHFVHTAIHLPLIDRESDPVPVTSPARTLIDWASQPSTSVKQLTVALDGALRDGLVSEDFVHRRLGALRGKGRHGVPRLLDALNGSEVERGATSWLEREFLRLVDLAGLPRPDTQQVLSRSGERTIRVDFRFPGTNLVAETLGYRWHRTGNQMQADAERFNRLVMLGYRVLQFTYRHVVEQPDWVVSQLIEALGPSFSVSA